MSILTNAISQANKFVYVAVSDYAPMNVFGKQRKPWPILDDLLREGLLEFYKNNYPKNDWKFSIWGIYDNFSWCNISIAEEIVNFLGVLSLSCY